MNQNVGSALAFSAAALFLGGCSKNQADTQAPTSSAEMVKCIGINDCKGQGLCDTATHDCAGKNECKGKGWVKVARGECEAIAGSVV
ncbi:MAG: DUF2282 domain-containing protein [Nannocystaceae bacterium]